MLGLLAAVAPINAAVVAAGFLRSALRPSVAAIPPGTSRTILVSGGKMTKALVLARAFHADGHRVVLVEQARYRFTGHRFSRSVDAFFTVPKPEHPGYTAALRAIVEREGVDVFVPVCSPVASYYDSLARDELEGICEVLHPRPDELRQVDDKFEFATVAKSVGLRVPDTHRITDPGQVAEFDFSGRERSYILKSIAYDPVRRLDLTRLPRPTPAETAAYAASLPISTDNPWILQEFIEGQEYCTHGTVRDGEVQVWCCCSSSASQLNYTMTEVPEIEQWVRTFCLATPMTGQLSFDFIVAPDGEVFAIECNPRTHSAISMFYNHPDLSRAYLDSGVETITPLPGSRPTYWLYHEVWRLFTLPHKRSRLRTILTGTDAIFTADDPLPFLAVHHLQIPWLLVVNLLKGGSWVKIDVNIGKLVEPGVTEVARRLRVLLLVGSAVSEFYADLSRLYAADCLVAVADPERYELSVAHVSPDGSWCFPADLAPQTIAVAPRVGLGEAVTQLQARGLDAVVPQMFCVPGMTHYRALVELMGIPLLGNPADVMALGANKALARAVVAAAGVAVPEGEVLRAGERAHLAPPFVVKPVDTDNSLGLALVRAQAELEPALRGAFAESDEVLVERYVELGREVRCGIVVRDGELVGLPLEEYAVHPESKPIRLHDDKIRASDGAGGGLGLVAKDAEHAWIVDVDDPLTAVVHEVAKACHRALGCRDYSLFDFRVDPDGQPWFLEAGLYCSFARSSVVAVMAAAAGVELPELFDVVLTEALARRPK